MRDDHVKDFGFDRRNFLQMSLGAAALVGVPNLGLNVAWGQEDLAGDDGSKGEKKLETSKLPNFGKAKQVIVLFMRGGPSHIDTWDPKPGRDTGGPFKPLSTKVSGMEIGEHLPRMAKIANRFSLVRSMNSREGSHERANYLLHTGYIPAGPVRHPDFGAIVACECGQKDFDLPNFISIGGSTINGGGFLGVEYAPFLVGDAGKPPENLSYAKGVDNARFQRRWSLLGAIEKTFGKGRTPALIKGHKGMIEKASKFMHSPKLKAFEINTEPKKVCERYGDSQFGRGALVARRLIEVGVPFVQVNLGGWDTHQKNFEAVEKLCNTLDPAMASLLEDLEDRKLLDSTLVLWVGDFGRTPKINKDNGRDHFPRAWSFVMAGGGIQGGRIHGATNADGDNVEKDQVIPEDLFATMAHCLGLDRNKENFSSAGRPLSLVDKKGSIIKTLVS